MQTYEDPPPPYPGTNPGDYAAKNTYQQGSANVIPPHIPNPGPIHNHGYASVPIVSQPTTYVTARAVPVGHRSIQCICPHCLQPIVTRVDYESGSFAWLMCLLLTVVGCVPCCVIPFFSTSCQDIIHTCPHCSAIIGRRKIL